MDHMREKETIWSATPGWLDQGNIELFLAQHFVGKQFTYDPSAHNSYATFTDGTAVYATNSDHDETYPMNMRDQQGTGTITRAWFEHDEQDELHGQTDTYRLYVTYEGDNTPHLITEGTFHHEIYEDWDSIYLTVLI